MRRTKIVATLGPTSDSEDRIAALIDAGVNVFRLNFSHGVHDDHRARLERVRRLAGQHRVPIAVIQDLQGPKIRTGTLTGGQPVTLCDGDRFVITARPVAGSAAAVSTTYPSLPGDVRPGDCILLDDGLMELRVVATDATDVTTEVVHGGLLQEHKGINLPGVRVSAPALTEKDRADLDFGLKLGVDYVALSFVRRPEDVVELKEIILSRGLRTPVIAKLEKPEALEHLDGILEVSDGVMVARGDLGVELSPQQVPTAQKTIIEAANRRHRLVITATQMLESMMYNPRPTRAEASDIANAIFDGTDAVMLSGETAAGQYPVEAVQTMAAIAVEAEANLDRWGRGLPGDHHTTDEALAVAHAATNLAHDLDARAIVAFTRSGRTALFLSKLRPGVPIWAFTPGDATYRALALAWGTTPLMCRAVMGVEEMIAEVEAKVKVEGYAGSGDVLVIAGGLPLGTYSPTNFLKVHRL
jgi:pyruvate kinase